ncbi:MAG: FeoB-associated Cys-rich membrane protein [Chthoniobacterales bacterium]
MTPEVQTWLALGIVFLTAIIFLFRFLRRRRSDDSCGGQCGCSKSPQQLK